MIQRLGEQMGINGERLVIAFLTAALVGILFAVLVHWIYERDPEHPYTFVFVIFGVAGTLAIALIVVPVQWIIVTTVLFGVTGAPQIVGAMLRNAAARRQERERDRRAIQDALR